MLNIDQLPIWGIFLGIVVILLIAVELGFRLGIWLQERRPESKDSRMTNTVAGGMLGLMAFLMAFSIGIVINQHNSRKEMVVTEANAIGTAWLRSGFFDEADAAAARELLREYTQIRLDAANSGESTLVERVVTRSEEIHSELWAIMEKNVKAGNNSDIMALIAESYNEVIDVHTLRWTAVNLRLPRMLGLMLVLATILSFLLIGVASSADGKRDTLAMVLFTVAYVAVLIIIIDLNRPQQGVINVSQTAMADLLRTITPSGQ
ncbi:MAG: DUF4239 domain-containing protein [Caldilineaceae bacterium]|nr:DUF4239 domain-containing protein [Caldilineaceae bacterium]